MHLLTASRPASRWCILRRRRSSTARMRTGVEIFRTNRSTFSASISERGNDVARYIRAHGSLPAASPKAPKAISQRIRRWTLYHRSDKALEELAEMQTRIQGWINYYGDSYRTQPRSESCRGSDFDVDLLGAP